MSEPFLAEIKIISFNFPPKGWAFCSGQTLLINQNQALFSLLGTTYGGDGRVNFALPDLRGRGPIHVGSGHTLGERGGEQAHTLSIAELPTHTHVANAQPNPATQLPAVNALGEHVCASGPSRANPDSPGERVHSGRKRWGGGNYPYREPDRGALTPAAGFDRTGESQYPWRQSHRRIRRGQDLLPGSADS
jgi:microcystin-dependent protein